MRAGLVAMPAPKGTERRKTMQVGDAQYRKLLRRLTTLQWLDAPMAHQEAEMARIDAMLTEAELKGRSLRGAVEDYEQLRQIGDLGQVEL